VVSVSAQGSKCAVKVFNETGKMSSSYINGITLTIHCSFQFHCLISSNVTVHHFLPYNYACVCMCKYVILRERQRLKVLSTEDNIWTQESNRENYTVIIIFHIVLLKVKIKLSLWLTKHHTMKIQGEWRYNSTHS